ncbi:hypothetical protein [Dysgonomonas capnocytophagoides]|uniref:hypothetical protein n=1 Tax=Dysgonomonas capnocytophagoides TaxID=45254 RepID=UPI00333E837F
MKIDNKAVFLFVTHKVNQSILERFYTLREQTYHIGESYFLLDTSNGFDFEIPEDIPLYTYNRSLLNNLGYTAIHDKIIPGSNHFITLQFFLDNPHFNHYWSIEYDVVYTEMWTDFFINFENIEADFISSHVETFLSNPYWYWWPTLHLKNSKIKIKQLLKSFNPIYRISNEALSFLNKFLKDNDHKGHHEVLIPTVLNMYGFKILDFGGLGEYVLPQFKERFYLTSSQYVGGTMRDKPPISEQELSLKNKLLHPVK